jgi:hypothetical protein
VCSSDLQLTCEQSWRHSVLHIEVQPTREIHKVIKLMFVS